MPFREQITWKVLWPECLDAARCQSGFPTFLLFLSRLVRTVRDMAQGFVYEVSLYSAPTLSSVPPAPAVGGHDPVNVERGLEDGALALRSLWPSQVSARKLQVSRATRLQPFRLSRKMKHPLRSMEVNGAEWRWWPARELLSLGWACRCQAHVFLLKTASQASRRFKNRETRQPSKIPSPAHTSVTGSQSTKRKNFAPL